MCFITADTVPDHNNYAICSCGNHLWNSNVNKLLTIHPDGFFIVSKNHIKYKVYTVDKKPFKLFWFIFLLYLIMVFGGIGFYNYTNAL
jgi:uncharacterized membrane protein